MPKKKVVVDPMGQWKYPGDITIIPSNNITMDGVNYPVLGVDNLGNQQMMMPGGSYTFPGDYVTEIPQMGKGGLTQWFAEEWTDIKTGKPCGRQKGENRAYPACRPKKRVNETTPKTTSEMSSAEKAKFKRSKTSGERISYNHKRKEYGGENWLDTYPVGGETSTAENPDRIAPVKITSKRAPWYQRLPRQIADKMGFYPYGYDTDPNDFSSQLARRMAQSADSPGGAFLGALSAPLAAPQLGMMYGLTGEAQTPSEYMDIQNPIGAFVTDAVLDPFVLGPSLVAGANKLGKAALAQAVKNPKLGLRMQRGMPVSSLDNITYSPGLRVGDVQSVEDFITTATQKPGAISEFTFFKGLGEGRASLNSSLQKRIQDLKSTEGFNRLVNQEREWLIAKGQDPSVAERVAKLNAKARINELENIGNINAHALKYSQQNFLGGIDNRFVSDNRLYNNAYYSPGYNTTVENKINDFINLKKPGVNDYSTPKPGGIGMGYNYINNKPIEMHEIAHALQRLRKLPIDDELRQLVPKPKLGTLNERAYNYFKTGSKGQEASAFANELREAMFQKGFIPDYYSPINQQQVQNAYSYFKKNPMGVYDKNTGDFISNTRIFDFMAPTTANSKILTDVLNKLPAVVPAVGAAGYGASQLQQQKHGGLIGWLNKYN